jgi:ABC-type polysaccharide/polyol phosphate export permease
VITELLRDSFRYRELIWALALKDLKIRYKRSILGFLWALLNPTLLMIVYSFVFSNIMRIPIPHYAVFLLTALLPWTFFSQSLAYAIDSFVANAELMKRVSVPKLVFPVAAVISNLINFLLSIVPLALIVVGAHHPFYWTWVFLPVPLLALLIFTLGVSFLFATANVYYRDVSHIVQILLQVWFYTTPIIYALDIFPAKYHWLFRFNPLVCMFNEFRLSVYYGHLPRLDSVAAAFSYAALALLGGFAIFKKHEPNFVYYF